uniref:Uncharacterized protein n=1 Tax=Daphnia galeata TaxID=27404 RepID=A0A8J2RHE4_9CRUS|nr:unnamed protein product [Daphnia galeata]
MFPPDPERSSLLPWRALLHQANQGLAEQNFTTSEKCGLLAILSVPYVIPIDVAYGILIRFAANASAISTAGKRIRRFNLGIHE